MNTLRKHLLGLIFLQYLTISHAIKPNDYNKSVYFTDSLYSNYLGEYRKHNIYLPPGYSKAKKYPIIYATDGIQNLENCFYKITFDSLISHKIIKPIIFLASHANDKPSEYGIKLTDSSTIYCSYRNLEYTDYFAGFNNSEINPDLLNRFQNHMLYFTKELIPNAEKKYNKNINNEYRYFYGFSNGGGFGMNMLKLYPEIIGTYICFSVFGGIYPTGEWGKNIKYPDLYLKFGSEEPDFLKQ